jgi:hypothetical protein
MAARRQLPDPALPARQVTHNARPKKLRHTAPPSTARRQDNAKPSLRATLENAGEGGAEAVENDQPANGCDGARQNAAWIHRYVEEQDVKQDGTRQRKGQRHILVAEKKESARELEQENGRHKVRRDQHGEELRGQRRDRGRRDEVQESVQPEDGKYQAQQIAGDDGGDFHTVLLVYAHYFAGKITPAETGPGWNRCGVAGRFADRFCRC